jgi:hypothetical protein
MRGHKKNSQSYQVLRLRIHCTAGKTRGSIYPAHRELSRTLPERFRAELAFRQEQTLGGALVRVRAERLADLMVSKILFVQQAGQRDSPLRGTKLQIVE